MIRFTIVPLHIALLALLATGYAGESRGSKKELFRKSLPDGRIAIVMEKTSLRVVDPAKQEKRLPPGTKVHGGEYHDFAYTLEIREKEDLPGKVLWKDATSVPKRDLGSERERRIRLRVFDLSVEERHGYILFAKHGRVSLGAFDPTGKKDAQDAPVQVFRESTLSLTARKGKIEVKDDGVYLAIDTLETKESWKVADGKATLLKKTGVFHDRRASEKGEDSKKGDKAPPEYAKLLDQSGKSGHVGKELRQSVLAMMKEEKLRGNVTDDSALILLAGIDKLDGAETLMTCYRTCAPQLKKLRLEEGTKKKWKHYKDLKDVLDEFMRGEGDTMMGIFVRAKVLTELQEQLNILKRKKTAKEEELKKIEAFITTEARKLLEEWPRSELKAMVKELAGEKKPE